MWTIEKCSKLSFGTLLILIFAVAASSEAAELPDQNLDTLGIKRLFPTKPGGREWMAQWQEARNVPAYEMDIKDPVCRNEAGMLKIRDGVAAVEPGMTRIVVMTAKDKDRSAAGGLFPHG